MQQGSEPIEELASLILRYVASRPDASDSLDGICEWWLARQRHDDARRDVAAALARLQASGHIEARKGIDGRIVYGLARKGDVRSS